MGFEGVAFHWFDFIPSWVIQDAIILILGVVTLIYIARHEKRPMPIILEMFSFIFLYASLYENFNTASAPDCTIQCHDCSHSAVDFYPWISLCQP